MELHKTHNHSTFNSDISIKTLEALRQEVGYVKKWDYPFLYETTKQLALSCDVQFEDARKLLKKPIKIFAGTYLIGDLWMLHNILIDFKNKRDWLLTREIDREGNFINRWNIVTHSFSYDSE